MKAKQDGSESEAVNESASFHAPNQAYSIERCIKLGKKNIERMIFSVLDGSGTNNQGDSDNEEDDELIRKRKYV